MFLNQLSIDTVLYISKNNSWNIKEKIVSIRIMKIFNTGKTALSMFHTISFERETVIR